MSKLPLSIGAASVALAALLTPSAARRRAGASVSEIIVYGTDPCPRSTDDEVVVCARKPETERYPHPRGSAPGRLAPVAPGLGGQAPRSSTTVGAHRHQQLLGGRPRRLHRLRPADHQRGVRGARRAAPNGDTAARNSAQARTFSAAIQRMICARARRAAPPPGRAPRRGTGAGRTSRPAPFPPAPRRSRILSSPSL